VLISPCTILILGYAYCAGLHSRLACQASSFKLKQLWKYLSSSTQSFVFLALFSYSLPWTASAISDTSTADSRISTNSQGDDRPSVILSSFLFHHFCMHRSISSSFSNNYCCVHLLLQKESKAALAEDWYRDAWGVPHWPTTCSGCCWAKECTYRFDGHRSWAAGARCAVEKRRASPSTRCSSTIHISIPTTMSFRHPLPSFPPSLKKWTFIRIRSLCHVCIAYLTEIRLWCPRWKLLRKPGVLLHLIKSLCTWLVPVLQLVSGCSQDEAK